MQTETSDRGFRHITHPGYPTDRSRGEQRLVSESSAIGEYDDAFDRPGSSFLWVGEHHRLDRDQVAELRDILTHWINHGRLPL